MKGIKMKKRQILALALTGVMVLAGCGGNKDTAEKEAASSGSAAAASETEESSSAEDSSDAEAESTSEEEEESLSGTEEESTSEAETESDPIMDIPVISGDFSLADCVKLGEYKGLELEMEVEPVTDEYLETYLGYMVDAVETEDPDAVVENGDIVNLDFVGKLDGEAFDGGSGEGYDLEIGSGTFIPGFEDQMVGMKKGETRDLELTFPESYVENLAGKDVVFTVTVNAIKRMPEMNDSRKATGMHITIPANSARNSHRMGSGCGSLRQM